MPNLKSSSTKAFRLPLIALVVACPLAWFAWTAYAATRTWDGGGGAANPNWTTLANWQSDLAPQPGDDLILPAGAQPNSSNNFASGTIFRSLSVSGGHTMSGFGIALTNGLTAANATINLSSIRLNNNQTFTAQTAGVTTTINSTIDFTPAANSIIIAGPGNFQFNGSMNTGGFIKTGTGTTTLAGAAATLSTTYVNEGTLQLGKTGGSLGPIQVLVVGDGTGANSSAIARMLANNQTQNNIFISSDGLYDLNGFSNTTTELTVNGGSVSIGAGTLTSSTTFMTGGNISSTGAGKLVLNGNVTVNAAPTVATISGNLDLGGGTRTFTVDDGGASDDLNITAVIGNGGLTKAGTGLLALRGNNTYTGTTTISAGRLEIRGDQPQSSVTVNGGTLAGTGTVGPVNATSGFVKPSLGGASFQILTVQGNLSLSSATTYVPTRSFCPVGATSNGIVNVVGTVNLGGSNFGLDVACGPANFLPGQTYVVLSNDGTDAVTGHFAGLAEGAPVGVFGLHITYRGGDGGNDVALFVPPLTRVWTGGGGDNKWSTQANWDGGVVPRAGDSLEFPSTGAQKTNVNDLAAGLALNAINFSGSGYNISGNAVTLAGGLSASANSLIGLTRITLTANQSFSGSLAVTSEVDVAGRTLSLSGGTTTIAGAILGTGQLVRTGGLGTVTLSGNNHNYTGSTSADFDALAINGLHDQSPVTLTNIGTLRGSGTTGPLTATGASINPSGILGVNGNLSLRRNANNGTGTLTIDINGPVPGTNYDQLNVTGAVNLNSNGSSPYSLTVNGSVTSGTQYVIINNDGADVVTGTFSGKSQGSTFAVGNRNVTISYTGGDGNDVVLTALVTTRTWDGQKDDGTASANANWMTKENWVGDVAPQASDGLMFPQNAERKLNFNDFPNGTTFTSITFSGGGYQLRPANSNSNNLNLTAGVTDNNASDNSADNNSIYLLVIGGAGGVTKNGAGLLGLLSSNNTYTGITAINGGTLIINGTQPSSPVNVTGGTLTGSGVTGAITANSGTVSPGFNLRANGAVIFNSAVTYSVRFITTDDVIELTKLAVTGTVNLGNSTLNSTYDNAPAMGNAFVIVENDDADAVTGTFSGLAEGANFTISRADGTAPLIFRISYRGGSGNDVTLTRVAPPTFSVDDVSINEGNSGQNNATFTVRRSEAIANASATVNYATTDGTATGMAPPESRDYVSISGTLTFNPGEAAKTINVPIFGDIVNEADETFFVTLSNPSNATIGDGQGVGTIRNDDQNTIVQFGAAAFSVTEASTGVPVTVTRTGDTSGASTVDYTSSDMAGLINCSVINGIASSRCDYATSVGTLRFAAGETAKTISIPIVDDAYAEGSESFTITLSNATGVALSSPALATVTINDNEVVNGVNPIDQTPFFVRQHYVDFLGREPDPPGFAAWQAIINNCPPNDTNCDRIHVSSAFFRSPEFQERGYFVYRFYPVAFGRKPDYVEFIPDLARVSGFLTDAQLEAAKVALINDFMARPAFVTKHNGLSNTHYVDTLLATAGVNHGMRDFWIAALGNGTKTRAGVLRELAESTEVYNKYYNQAFVVMQYFGYLRRDPDALYVDWIQELDTTNNFRTMVNGFMNSPEYRFRFGP